jgi:hypothetical protein
LPPTSVGASKLGDVLNLINTVTESEVMRLNKEASAPAEIVTVADSETRIVAAFADVAMFSATEKEDEEVKVGAVVSGAVSKKVIVIVCVDAPHVVPFEPPQLALPINGLRL